MKKMACPILKMALGLAVVAVVVTACSNTETIIGTGTTYEFTATVQNSGTSQDLLDIFFTDTSNGWAVGADGTIIHTTDGGKNWSPQDANTSAALQGVCFISDDTGWVVGNSGMILHTTDGGETWAKQASSGATWHTDSLPDTILYAVSFVDNTHGWVVAFGSTPKGIILHTDDGGRSWIPQQCGATNPLLDIFFVDANHGWAAGVDGSVIFHTSDGGANWKRQSPNAISVLRDVVFWNTLAGIAVGDKGTIRTTLDGGTTWSVESSGVTGTLRKAAFGNADNIWIAGDSGLILKVTRVEVKGIGRKPFVPSITNQTSTNQTS